MTVVVEPVMGAGSVGQDRDEEALGFLTPTADETAIEVGLSLKITDMLFFAGATGAAGATFAKWLF